MILKPAVFIAWYLIFVLFLGNLSHWVGAIKEILISTYDPVVTCSLEEPLNPQLMYGIEINIMRAALAEVNWTEGIDYYFNCSDLDDQFAAVAAGITDRPNLLGIIGGITISHDRLKTGAKFSQPTMSTGLSLLYRNVPHNAFYLRTFTTDFFVLLVILPTVGGFFLYLFQGRRISLMNYIYHAATVFFKIDDDQFQGTIARITGMGLKLLLLITSILYVAFTTNILTADNSFGGVSGISDLKGLRISSIGFYKNTLQSVGTLYKYFPDVWDSAELIKTINSEEVTFMAYDDPILAYLTYTECNFYMVLQNFVKYDFGVMMPSGVSSADEELVNIGLTMAFTKKTQDLWVAEYFSTQPITTCPDKIVFQNTVLSFGDVQGLWYAWLGVFGIGLVNWVAVELRKFSKKKRGDYNFEGLRAKADQELQRKMAALTATQCAGSITVVNESRTVLQNDYSVALKALNIDYESVQLIQSILKLDDEFSALDPKVAPKKSISVTNGLKKKRSSILSGFKKRFSSSISLMKVPNGSNSRRGTVEYGGLTPRALQRTASLSQSGENASTMSPIITIETSRGLKSKFHRKSEDLTSPILIKPKEIKDLIKNTSDSPLAKVTSPSKSRGSNNFVIREKAAKKFGDHIKQIYPVRRPKMDGNMLESVVQKVLEAEEKQKQRDTFYTNRELDDNLQSIVSPKIPVTDRLRGSERASGSKRKRTSEFGTNSDAVVITMKSSIEKAVQYTDEPLLVPRSRTPKSNIREHTFTPKNNTKVLRLSIPIALYKKTPNP